MLTTFQTVRLKREYAESVRLTPPCLDNEAEISYMNTAQVREALHIPNKVQNWDVCR